MRTIMCWPKYRNIVLANWTLQICYLSTDSHNDGGRFLFSACVNMWSFSRPFNSIYIFIILFFFVYYVFIYLLSNSAINVKEIIYRWISAPFHLVFTNLELMFDIWLKQNLICGVHSNNPTAATKYWKFNLRSSFKIIPKLTINYKECLPRSFVKRNT